MHLFDALLQFFAIPRSWFISEGNEPPSWLVFLLSVIFYFFIAVFIGMLLNLLYTIASAVIEAGLKWLSKSSSIAEVVQLESHFHRIDRTLYWLCTRITRPTSPYENSVLKLPKSHEDGITFSLLRYLLRKVHTLIAKLLHAPYLLIRAMGSPVGLGILIAASFTAYPSKVRAIVAEFTVVAENIRFSADPVVFATTVGAASLTLVLVAGKILIGERSIARRTFRRNHNETILRNLHMIKPKLIELLDFLTSQMEDSLRDYNVERNSAVEWHEWATHNSVSRRSQWRPLSDHISCEKSCISYGGFTKQQFSSSLPEELATALTEIWQKNISGCQWDIARFLRGRYRRSFISLMICFRSPDQFKSRHIPRSEYWKDKRISWQHRHLSPLDPTPEDTAAGRSVSIREIEDPNQGWLNDDLVDLLWDLAELRRDVETVAIYVGRLTHSRTIDAIIKATE